jgi:predicted AAA+ superfamily ATPase
MKVGPVAAARRRQRELAATLRRERDMLGPLLETFVLQELRRQASERSEPLSFLHFRDRDDFEVDIVIERGTGQVAGVEVKAAPSVAERDVPGLRKLGEAAGRRFASGVVRYDHEAGIDYGDCLHAIPLRALVGKNREGRRQDLRRTAAACAG